MTIFKNIKEALKTPDKVTALFIQGNEFNPDELRLPAEIAKLSHLETLHIFDKKIIHLPSELKQLPSLRQIELMHCSIQQIPEPFHEIKSLEKLIIEGSDDVFALSPELQGLENLKILYLVELGISSLPDEIGLLKNLEELDLSYNVLSDLPENFSDLLNLKKLDLGFNKFTFIPPQIFALERLEELHLCGEGEGPYSKEPSVLEFMAVDFAKLKNLKILDLSGQRVKSIPDSIFKLKLSELNLAQNQIGQSEQDKIKKSLPGTTVRF